MFLRGSIATLLVYLQLLDLVVSFRDLYPNHPESMGHPTTPHCVLSTCAASFPTSPSSKKALKQILMVPLRRLRRRFRHPDPCPNNRLSMCLLGKNCADLGKEQVEAKRRKRQQHRELELHFNFIDQHPSLIPALRRYAAKDAFPLGSSLCPVMQKIQNLFVCAGQSTSRSRAFP